MNLWIIVWRKRGAKDTLVPVQTTGGPPTLDTPELATFMPGFQLDNDNWIEYQGPFPMDQIKKVNS